MGKFQHLIGGTYDQREAPDGEWSDAWNYDDELMECTRSSS